MRATNPCSFSNRKNHGPQSNLHTQDSPDIQSGLFWM